MLRDRLGRMARRAASLIEGRREPGRVPGADRAFAAFHDAAEGAVAMVGAALVSTWEIGLTDVGRALAGKIPDDRRAALVERLSDGLVPVQQPINAAGHRLRAAAQQAARQSLAGATPEAAAAGLSKALSPLAAETQTGWERSTDWLADLFQVYADPPAVRARFAAVGGEVARVLSVAAVSFSRALDEAATGTELEAGLLAALEAWRAEACAGLERVVYTARTALVEAPLRAGEAP